jgi:hypothetical protein
MKKEFKISLDLYPEEKIKQAIEDFKEVWEITLEQSKLIINWDNQDEIEEIFNECMNYIIALVND